jgi:ribosomal protein S18 acetylase RimI-like enzyme
VGALRAAASRMGVIVRPLLMEDRNFARDALIDCGVFSDEEVMVAVEMVEAGLHGEYSLLGITTERRQLCGYACFGPAPLTESSWYLYWICVRRSAQGAGIGRMLQTRVEDAVRELGGERLILETSGRDSYERARRFYCQMGFVNIGSIPDFYKPGDTCLIYCKVLGSGEAMR